jgi:hypothetical protein
LTRLRKGDNMLVSDWLGYGVNTMLLLKTIYRKAFKRVWVFPDFIHRLEAFGFLLSMISPVVREGKATV